MPQMRLRRKICSAYDINRGHMAMGEIEMGEKMNVWMCNHCGQNCCAFSDVEPSFCSIDGTNIKWNKTELRAETVEAK